MSRRNLYPLGLILLLAGCVPVAEPLSDVAKAEPDKKLLGKWEHAVDGTEAYVVDIPEVKGNPKGLMRAVGRGLPDDDKNTFWFVATTIGKHTYATIYLAPGKGDDRRFADFRTEGTFEKHARGKDRRYFVFRYTIDGDKLVVDAGDKSGVEKLMLDETIEINVDTGFYKTPEGWLAKYLTKTGPDKVFDGSNTQEYRRPKK